MVFTVCNAVGLRRPAAWHAMHPAPCSSRHWSHVRFRLDVGKFQLHFLAALETLMVSSGDNGNFLLQMSAKVTNLHRTHVGLVQEA